MNEKTTEIRHAPIFDNRVSGVLDTKMRLNGFIYHLKASLTRPEAHRVPVERVRRAFAWIGNQDLTATALGDAFVNHGVERIIATRARIQCVPKLDGRAMVKSILNDMWAGWVQERKAQVRGDLTKARILSTVERIVSNISNSETHTAIEKGAA